jgi:hypothetical protein
MSSWNGLDLTEDDPRKRGQAAAANAGSASSPASGSGSGSGSGPSRPALQVYFKCANAYQHVLRSADGSGYSARCPKCGHVKQFVVGEGGVEQRTFVLTCR